MSAYIISASLIAAGATLAIFLLTDEGTISRRRTRRRATKIVRISNKHGRKK